MSRYEVLRRYPAVPRSDWTEDASRSAARVATVSQWDQVFARYSKILSSPLHISDRRIVEQELNSLMSKHRLYEAPEDFVVGRVERLEKVFEITPDAWTTRARRDSDTTNVNMDEHLTMATKLRSRLESNHGIDSTPHAPSTRSSDSKGETWNDLLRRYDAVLRSAQLPADVRRDVEKLMALKSLRRYRNEEPSDHDKYLIADLERKYLQTSSDQRGPVPRFKGRTSKDLLRRCDALLRSEKLPAYFRREIEELRELTRHRLVRLEEPSDYDKYLISVLERLYLLIGETIDDDDGYVTDTSSTRSGSSNIYHGSQENKRACCRRFYGYSEDYERCVSGLIGRKEHRERYRQLIRKNHPDKNSGSIKSTKRTQKLNACAGVLGSR